MIHPDGIMTTRRQVGQSTSLTWEEVKPDARGIGYFVLAAPPMDTLALVRLMPEEGRYVVIEDYCSVPSEEWVDTPALHASGVAEHVSVRNMRFDLLLPIEGLRSLAPRLGEGSLNMFVVTKRPSAGFSPWSLKQRGQLTPELWKMTGLLLGIDRPDVHSPVLFSAVDADLLAALRRRAP